MRASGPKGVNLLQTLRGRPTSSSKNLKAIENQTVFNEQTSHLNDETK